MTSNVVQQSACGVVIVPKCRVANFAVRSHSCCAKICVQTFGGNQLILAHLLINLRGRINSLLVVGIPENLYIAYSISTLKQLLYYSYTQT